MTSFGCPVKNAQDLKVLFVGFICTMLIFSFVTIIEGHGGGFPMVQVDLVQEK